LNGAVNAEHGEVGAHAVLRSERGADAFVRAQRHSRRVRALKFVLPVAAVTIAGLFLGYSLLSSATGGGTVNLDSASIEDGNLVMHNPALNGFTSGNLPYSMKAVRARQAIGSDMGPIELEQIQAMLPLNSEHQATISAGGGIFDRQSNHILLTDAITLTTTSGIVARLESANVDIGSGNLSTDDPVDIELSGMRVRADTFRATEGGNKLVFENRVRLEIAPANLRRAQEQESGGDG
jgi:lipopolysaccharide export system protein LptC